MPILNESPTIQKYRNTMKRCIRMYYPEMDPIDIDPVLDYSIEKRYKKTNAQLSNSYTNRTADMTLLAISDYIASRHPIVTAFGTMFRNRGDVPNPMGVVVQSFLDKRSEDKKLMFKYPKGSELFEKYNLLQQLDKIDANGIYGVLGMYTSLLYNINVATSITSQGRALVSSMTLCFEQFLANNVKFGSLNEVMQFIDNIVQEKKYRKYSDLELLDNPFVSRVNCFAKVVLSCGYRWIPTEKELDIIWRTINNLSQEDVNRVYYKNNLYEFMSNSKVLNLVKNMLRKLKSPLLNSLDIPKEISKDIKLFTDLMMEYVYYRYMIIDRTDRCDNMIKSVTMVSDTDSTIISLDAWYRFIAEEMNGEELRIANHCLDPVMFIKKDEFGDWTSTDWRDCVEFEPKKFDYDFRTDSIVELEHQNNPEILTPNDNVRFSIINILAYVLDRVVNDYMEQFCLNNNSLFRKDDDWQLDYNYPKYIPERLSFDKILNDIDEGKDLPYEVIRTHSYDHPCKILAKNEFTFKRLMMTMVKKNYASLIAVQEGNMVPEDKQLDIKGIECLTKSSKSLKTRKALQKILLEDILKAPAIDQLKFVKDMAIFERQIINSLKSGSKEYYKPVTIKSANTYSDPMRIQGIKASIAWNSIKPKELPAINLEERNAINIAKVKIAKDTIDIIKDEYPDIFDNINNTLDKDEFKDGITALAIPMDVNVPKWLENFIDYTTIIADNISGFPYESIGIMRMGKSNVNYTNIVKL